MCFIWELEYEIISCHGCGSYYSTDNIDGALFEGAFRLTPALWKIRNNISQIQLFLDNVSTLFGIMVPEKDVT